MKVRRLRLENYRRHREVDLELPDGVMAIVGPNGSGKSSLLEAIGFALFGTQATRTPKALLRHADAAPSDPVRVTLALELAGQAVEVVREFRGLNLTAHATLTIDGRPLVASGANSHAAVTQEIERLLGMDRSAFFTSIVAQQKELSRLADLKPAERKQMILRLLGVDAVDRAIEEGRARRRRAEQRLQDLRDDLPDLKQLEQASKEATQQAQAAEATLQAAHVAWKKQQEALSAAQSAHEAAENAAKAYQEAHERARQTQEAAARIRKELETASKDLEAAVAATHEAERLAAAAQARPGLAEAVAKAKRLRHEAEASAQAKADMDQVQTRLSELPQDAPDDPQPLRRELDDLQTRIHDLARERAAQETILGQASAHKDRLAGADEHAPCPFCEQPLDEALPALRTRIDQEERAARTRLATLGAAEEQLRSEEHAARRRLDAARSAWTAWQEAEAQRKVLQARLEELRPRCVDIEVPDLAPLEARLQEAEAAEQAYIRAQTRAEPRSRLQEAVDRMQADLTEAAARQTQAEAACADLPAVDVAGPMTRLASAQAAERNAERNVHAAATARDLAQKEATHAAQRVQNAQDARKRIRTVEVELRLWTALAGGRNRGLLESFRTHMVGKIRPAINAEASRLLSRFTEGRYRELLLDEEYGVFVVDEGVPYTLDRFSGGESDLAHLALRLAVSRLLAQRSGAPELRFLALDEVFGSLDRHRRDAVLSALHSLDELYSQVVLVTHQEGLHEALDAVLEVRSDGDASQVRFHQG